MANPNPHQTSADFTGAPAGDLIASAIESSATGKLPFSEVMKLALYGEDVGFYSSGKVAIGRAGDFFTSVSAGSCFGTLLARHCANVWSEAGNPDQFLIVEQGAHDGRLASDVLDALEEMGSPLREVALLCLIEPREKFRSMQRSRLHDRCGNRLFHLPSPRGLADHFPGGKVPQGVFLANELLDAFPVHRLCFGSGEWTEAYVSLDGDGFKFVTGELSSPELESVVAKLPDDVADGYITEVNLEAGVWINEVAASGFRGELCLIDYGLNREDYYSPARAEGTLRRYFSHKMDGEILHNLGAADITAHLEITSLVETALESGFGLIEVTDQHQFLIRLAAPWLRQLESRGMDGDSEPRIRQFQTLIHPSMMGQAFKVIRLRAGG